MTINNGSGSPTDSVRQAIQTLFDSLGKPVRDETWPGGDESARWGRHPVFLLADHYRGSDHGDAGYTANPYRCDHMSIPSFTEDGDVFVIDISFHEGDKYIERISFPEEPPGVRKALSELLESCETR